MTAWGQNENPFRRCLCQLSPATHIALSQPQRRLLWLGCVSGRADSLFVQFVVPLEPLAASTVPGPCLYWLQWTRTIKELTR